MKTSKLAAAIDWGGTKLMVGLVSSDGTVVVSTEKPTPTDSPHSVLCLAETLMAEILSSRGLSIADTAGLGMSLPGVVDNALAELVISPARGWRNVSIRSHLPSWKDHLVVVGNDVDNCLLAECLFGVARGQDNVLWMTISTGVGGSILSNGRRLKGAGAAGEIGHIVVREDGPQCGCGNRGCLEALASGPSISRLAREAGLGEIDARALAECAKAGDAASQAIFAAVSVDVGRALGAALNLIDPEIVVLGGGVSTALDLDIIRSTALARSIQAHPRRPEFHLTALGRSVALTGAAALVFQHKGLIHSDQ